MSALALVAASVHAGNAKIGLRVNRQAGQIVGIVARGAGAIDMAGMRVGRGPAGSLPHAFVLGFKQCAHLFRSLLRGKGLRA